MSAQKLNYMSGNLTFNHRKKGVDNKAHKEGCSSAITKLSCIRQIGTRYMAMHLANVIFYITDEEKIQPIVNALCRKYSLSFLYRTSKKSMHYNLFGRLHSEKDILKQVNTINTNWRRGIADW